MYCFRSLLILLLLTLNLTTYSIILPRRPSADPPATYFHESGDGSSSRNNANNIHEIFVNYVHGIQPDAIGGYYFSDSSNNRVRYVDASDFVHTVVGSDTGASGTPTNDVLGTACRLGSPVGLTMTKDYLLLIAAYDNHRVLAYDPLTLKVKFFVGNGVQQNFPVSQTLAGLASPTPFVYRLASDSQGFIYMILLGQKIILKYDPVLDQVTHFAGGGNNRFGTGIDPKSSAIAAPRGIFISPTDDIYIADTSNYVIKKISKADGLLTVIVGTGKNEFQVASPYIPPLQTDLYFPYSITGDNLGNIFFSSQNTIFKFEEDKDILTVVAGSGSLSMSKANSNHMGTDINLLSYPLSLAVLSEAIIQSLEEAKRNGENLFRTRTLRALQETGSPVPSFLPTSSPTSSPSWIPRARSDQTSYVLLLGQQHFISRLAFQNILERPLPLIPEVSYGDGKDGFYTLSDPDSNRGKNGQIRIEASQVDGIRGMHADGKGGLYFSDYFNNRVRYINTFNEVRTIMGSDSGAVGSVAHDQLGTDSVINGPTGLEYDSGSLVVALFGNFLVCRYEIETGIIKLFIGSGTAGEFQGNVQASLVANIGQPSSIAYDTSGGLYVASFSHESIYYHKGDLVERVLGTGVPGSFNPGSVDPLTFGFHSIYSIYYRDGYLYISDYHNHAVRRFHVETSNLSTVLEEQYLDSSGVAHALDRPMGLIWTGTSLVLTANITLSGQRQAVVLEGKEVSPDVFHFSIISGQGSLTPSRINQAADASTFDLNMILYSLHWDSFDNNIYVGTGRSIHLLRLADATPTPTQYPIPPPDTPTAQPSVLPDELYPTYAPTSSIVIVKTLTTFGGFPLVEMTEVDREILAHFFAQVFSIDPTGVTLTSIVYLTTEPFKDSLGNILYQERRHRVEAHIQLSALAYPGMQVNEIVSYFSNLYQSMIEGGVLTVKLRKTAYNFNYPYADIVRVVSGEVKDDKKKSGGGSGSTDLTPIIVVVVIVGVLIILAVLFKERLLMGGQMIWFYLSGKKTEDVPELKSTSKDDQSSNMA